MSGRRQVPVLFLVFNRPAETARVFEALRAHQPARLFIACDGPRRERPAEANLVREVREIVGRVDWPCEIKTLFRDENLGCGPAVSGALDWFFGEVEEGIVLEDDCLPHPDFFPYCTTLLERFRADDRVATVAGTHFLPPALPHRQPCYASKYFQMWGWASWRRVWRHYDFTLSGLSEDGWLEVLRRRHPIELEVGYWREIYRAIRNGSVDTWDFQVFFSCWRLGGVHLMPGRNLVSNIGFGPSATHTNFASSMANLPTFPLQLGPEPVPVQPDPAVDNIIFYLRFLESLTHTWWIDQVVAPDRKLADTRVELLRKDRLVRQLEHELGEKRRQLRDATRALAEAAHGRPA